MTIITRTSKQAVELWIESLRSGKYKQTHHTLRYKAGDDEHPEYQFCCLGVLCDLVSRDGGPQWEGNTFLGSNEQLPGNVRLFVGLTVLQQRVLINMNDEDNASFDEIADYIETYVLPNSERFK